MDVSAVSVVFASLSVVAIVVGLVALSSAMRSNPGRPHAFVRRFGPAVAATIAVTATAGSLWYSERAGFVPCTFCWYQRIAMYPLVVVLGVGLLRRDRTAAYTSFPLAAVGLALAAYHVQLQWFPEQSNACGLVAPCTQQWVDAFGFVSIPMMAGAGFFAIASLALSSMIDLRRDRQLEATSDPSGNETPPRDEASALVPQGPSTR